MTPQVTMILMLAVTVGAALYVAWPLLFGRVRAEDYLALEGAEPALQRLYVQRDGVYAAMKELEFEFATGKLSEHDFQQLQERYKRKAVAILKRIDDARAGRLSRGALVEFEDDLEVERPRAPRKAGRRAELDVEQEIEAFRRRARESGEAAALTCPSCGRPVLDPEAVFCAKCGAPVRDASPQGRKKPGNK